MENFQRDQSVRYIGTNVRLVGRTGVVVETDFQGEDHHHGVHVNWGEEAGKWWHRGIETQWVVPNVTRGVGLKFDAGKVQARLLREGVPRALEELDKVLTFGAGKYAAHSWQHVENGDERYQDASYRHDAARNKGELFDQETGLRHRAHHIINELFLLELELRGEGLDAIKEA
jgi:hypothetical protein